MFDGSCPVTLLKFIRDVRISFNEVFVSDGVALVMFGRLLSKKAGRLHSSYVSANIWASRAARMVSWSVLIQTYLQRYLTDSALTKQQIR